MTEDHHLDDDQLSAALDGEGEAEAAAHLRACAACATRLDAIRRAVALVGEPVAPPAPDAVDQAVAAALRARDVPPSAARARSSRRRYLAPSLPWAAAAAAAIALLVGLSALLQTTGSDDDIASTAGDESSEGRLSDDGGDAAVTGAPVESFQSEGTGAASGFSAGGPAGTALEDLGAHDNPDTLAAAVRSRVEAIPRQERTERGHSGGDVPCRPEAEAVGGSRLAGLVHAATAQWKGEPAYVLTFVLAERGDDQAEHQMYVMSSSACALLAEARF